jgi:ribosomal-protein-alanine N-acetyltransferase
VIDLISTPRLRLEGTGWGPRRIIRAFDGLLVGNLEFFGDPLDAEDGVPEVEVRCTLERDARGHGAATEAVLGMLGEADRLGVRVRASVRPENRAAVRVLAKCGFTSLRGADVEGNLVMVRPLPTSQDRRGAP